MAKGLPTLWISLNSCFEFKSTSQMNWLLWMWCGVGRDFFSLKVIIEVDIFFLNERSKRLSRPFLCTMSRGSSFIMIPTEPSCFNQGFGWDLITIRVEHHTFANENSQRCLKTCKALKIYSVASTTRHTSSPPLKHFQRFFNSTLQIL